MVSFNTAITNKLNALSETMLNGHYIFSQNYSDDSLAKRFGTKPKYAHNVSFGVALDRDKINSYYSIRENSYRSMLCDSTFDGGEDQYDLNSNIFIAEAGSNCIGGVRITVSRPGQQAPLPLESDGFDLKETFADLGLENVVYGEPSRLAILPEFRDGHVLDKLQMESALYYANELGVEIVFGRSHAVQTRRFRKIFTSMGYKFVARMDLKLPYKDYDTHLWAVDFTPDARHADLLRSCGAQVANKYQEIRADLEFA